MITEIACIAVGIPLGYAVRKKPSVIRFVGTLTTWSIYALLFLLGLSLGANDEVFLRAPELGARSLVISLCALFGSVLAAWGVARLLPEGALDGPAKRTDSSAGAPRTAKQQDAANDPAAAHGAHHEG